MGKICNPVEIFEKCLGNQMFLIAQFGMGGIRLVESKRSESPQKP